MSNHIKPNPNVYRYAARIVARAECYRDQYHTCLAIGDACRKLNLSPAERAMHEAQYQAMFGPYHPDGQIKVWNNYFGEASVIGTYRSAEGHPFWNKSLPVAPTQDDQERIAEIQGARVNALLFMAEIVEQGCC